LADWESSFESDSSGAKRWRELEIGHDRMMIAGGRRHHLVAHAPKPRVMENMIEHEGAAAPRDFRVLHGREAAVGELIHKRAVFAHIEIAGEDGWAASPGQVLRHEIPLKWVLRAARSKHEKREQVRIE
jgi:hypothetical protein